MKKNIICQVVFVGCLALAACQPKSATIQNATTQNDPEQAGNVSVTNRISDCNIALGDLTFTHAINGADTCVSLLPGGALEFRCAEGLDFFCDPNDGKLSNNTLPVLLVPTDNTKPFTLTAKVTPEFTGKGLYNAADLFVYVNDTLWQKLAFEQDEYGNHRIVSVRTQGTSDDSNHDKIGAPSVYLKISSDTRTIASYYSLDKKEWHMVRLYRNYYPEEIYLGISSQCPQEGGCTSLIEEVTLSHENVGDFRMGE